MNKIIQKIKENWHPFLISFGMIVFIVIISYSVSQIAKIEVVERNCECEITKTDVEEMIKSSRNIITILPKQNEVEELVRKYVLEYADEGKFILKGVKGDKGDKGDRGDKCEIDKQDIIDTLHFAIVLDGAVEKPQFSELREMLKGDKGEQGDIGRDGISIKGDKGERGLQGLKGEMPEGHWQGYCLYQRQLYSLDACGTWSGAAKEIYFWVK